MENIILVGYGGHAKSVADCIEQQKKYHIIGYTDLEEHNSQYRYLGTDDVLGDLFSQGVHNAAVCIGYLGKGTIREAVYQRLKEIGYHLPAIIDPSAIYWCKRNSYTMPENQGKEYCTRRCHCICRHNNKKDGCRC